ncbi:MAG: NADH:ubiquinone reductase (Na(+)-transporting) subunit E [Granulosicoccus sp.]|nr:NADH:ubiquinone reductase (Na(+)-transporting) subunit E [Granulosicoccus sp.]
MTELFVTAIVADNLALAFFLGMCTFLAVSRRVATAVGLGICMIVVLGLTLPLNQLVYTHFLRPGALAGWGLPELDLSFLTLVCAIGLIAAVVQVLEMLLYRYVPELFDALGVFLPLITVNCAILGGSLFMVERQYTLAESAVYGIGSGIGWALAVIMLAAIRERLEFSRIPEGLRGLGISFIVTGLLSLGFASLAGAG